MGVETFRPLVAQPGELSKGPLKGRKFESSLVVEGFGAVSLNDSCRARGGLHRGDEFEEIDYQKSFF